MPFPENPIISAGTRVLVGITPTQSDTFPLAYTLTATAAVSLNATSISLTGTPTTPAGIRLQHGRRLTFGATTVEVNIPGDADPQVDDLVGPIAATAVNVPILPAPAAILANATSTPVYELFSLLGITQANPVLQPQTTDTTDMLSGFGQKQSVVGVNRSIQVQGFRIDGDRAMHSIIMPYLTNDITIRRLLFAQVEMPNGDIYSGPVRITDGNQTNQVRNPMQYNLTFTFQGNNFSYSSPVEAAMLT